MSALARQLDAFPVAITLDLAAIDDALIAMHRLPRPARECDRRALEQLFVALHCSTTSSTMLPVQLIPTNLR